MNKIKDFKSTIFHAKNLNLSGSKIVRVAIRAVIMNKDKILMIYSGVNHDYKFPGGGVKEGESHEETVRREIKEECGLKMSMLGSLLGQINEYNVAFEKDIDYFKMESIYYLCSVASFDFQELKLDRYEKELEFRPEWVSIKNALAQNRKVIDLGNAPKWAQREALFLEFLQSNLGRV